MVVLVKRIDVMGVYVSLIEYDDTEGMILLSELSRRRIRSVKKLVSFQFPGLGRPCVHADTEEAMSRPSRRSSMPCAMLLIGIGA